MERTTIRVLCVIGSFDLSPGFYTLGGNFSLVPSQNKNDKITSNTY